MRTDDLQIKGRNGKNLMIYQNPDSFCFGVDAVLLSAFARVKKNENVLDMCSGNGIIPLLLSAKTNAAHIDAVEIQADSAGLAQKSVALNGLQEVISVKIDDIKTYTAEKKYDCITCNPPYKEASGGKACESESIAVARNEILCSITDVCECASRNLKYGGLLFMIHRPERLADVICAMRSCDIEPKRVRTVHSYENKPPVLLLFEGRKCGNAKLIFEKPLIIYNPDGSYTDEVLEIYGKSNV